MPWTPDGLDELNKIPGWDWGEWVERCWCWGSLESRTNETLRLRAHVMIESHFFWLLGSSFSEVVLQPCSTDLPAASDAHAGFVRGKIKKKTEQYAQDATTLIEEKDRILQHLLGTLMNPLQNRQTYETMEHFPKPPKPPTKALQVRKNTSLQVFFCFATHTTAYIKTKKKETISTKSHFFFFFRCL